MQRPDGALIITRLTNDEERFEWHGGDTIWLAYEFLLAIPHAGECVPIGPYTVRCIEDNAERQLIVAQRISAICTCHGKPLLAPDCAVHWREV